MNYQWYTAPQAAEYFGKDVSVIRRWCYTGAALDFGFRVRRDLTGHWQIGIPRDSIQVNQVNRALSVDTVPVP